jgi:hypothetical protein
MRARTKKKLDTIAFAGVVLAFGGLLVWFIATLPH